MINILLCGNEKVFDGALTELISITNKTKETITCYILTMDVSRIKPEYTCITDEQIEFLNKVVKNKKTDNKVIKVDITDLYEKEFGNCKNENAYCTPYTLLRLLADKVEQIPDKILYLDIDMMANGDISELYNIDISEYEYAAVKEKYGSIFIWPDYINAGMLLLNMKKIKETKLLEKARELIKTKKMLFADQDAIYRATTKKKLLPRIYNEQSAFNRKETIICHFCKRLLLFPYPRTENYKQWHINEIHRVLKCYSFDKDLEEYVKLKEEYQNRIGEKIMNKDNKIIPIFFAIDDAYTPFLAVAIQSLIDNSSKEYNYLIKVLHTNVQEEHQNQIKKYETENVNIEFVDLSYYIEKVKDKLYTRDYYTNTTYFRLFLPELYPQYDKVLYLDSDIIVLGDISELYNTDMGTDLVAAAPDDIIQYNKIFQDYAELVVGVAKYQHYFNAGVLLMNLHQLRKFNFQEKFLYLLEKVKFSVAQDQDYLNRLCKGRVTLISHDWDVMPYVNNETKPEEIKLIHYNFAYKPWHFEDVTYNEYFWEYAKKTEFYEEIVKIKDSYTEEQKFQDREAEKALAEMAIKENACVGDDREYRR